MITVPEQFRSVRYNTAQYPGAVDLVNLAEGANCQLFAYELLRHFGLTVPDFRSSELWDDARYTRRVRYIEPLDLLLWNKTTDAWGAHVGVYLGEEKIVHLSRDVGVPAVWHLAAFRQRPKYRKFIGAKRIV